MKVRLIPVIEMQPADTEVSSWATPYHKDLILYRIDGLTNSDLAIAVKRHTEDYRNGEYEREQCCPLFGGYILNIDGVDEYFPQCCGDLSEIFYWMNLSEGKPSFMEGHPEPLVKFKKDSIILEFNVGEYDEHFSPAPKEPRIVLERSVLGIAVTKAKKKLEDLSLRLIKINETEHLGIERIDDLLIWENNNNGGSMSFR